MIKRLGGDRRGVSFTRRHLLKFSLVSVSASPFLRASTLLAAPAPLPWPEYYIRRPQDELFLRFRAVGYRPISSSRRLRPLGADRFLVFSVVPQHFAETALVPTDIPAVFNEDDLQEIELLPSNSSTIVFRVPHRHSLELTLEDLLAWHKFELVLPDLDRTGADYDLEINSTVPALSTRIEIPWGIELSPASSTAKFSFSEPPRLGKASNWTELWTTSLIEHNDNSYSKPVEMEVLSVRGFDRLSTSGSADQGNLVITYKDRDGQIFPKPPSPITNYDRIDIASSLSRRFKYTAVPKTPPIESARLDYTTKNSCVSLSACFKPGRTITAKQLRLSARGGWLQLDGKWDPFPGCALSGWVHSASLGRDSHVEVISEGFLFPFGTPCELVVLSERVFSKDQDGHFVSPLIKQAFLQIPQPNSISVEHAETPFTSISVTTQRSPPLDLPEDGDPGTYRLYDFFLPTVNGAPFQFEHSGKDWNGAEHRSSMPMLFVSNKARLANGLIWEPGYSWNSSQQPVLCVPSGSGEEHAIPKDGDGFRVVDKVWSLQPGRFAKYGSSLIALAANGPKGETAQKVEWIEWTRANVPDLNPQSIEAPFRPRARTMRIRVHATEQLSGEPSASIVSYRDLRFTDQPFLDPEPTTDPSLYFSNVTAQREAPDSPYVYMLETRALVEEAGPVKARTGQQAAMDIRDLYYNVSIQPSPIPSELFSEIDNEIRFGNSTSAEGVGGLSVPDTHANTLNRKVGLLGDATFNERRWAGYTGPIKSRIQATQRLDYAAFATKYRSKLDLAPFDKSHDTQSRTDAVNAARKVMGLPAVAAHTLRMADVSPPTGLKLGDLFGADAQIIPGLRFADIFEKIALADSSGPIASAAGAPAERAASPLVWNVRLTGIEWLTQILNADVGSISLADVISALREDAHPSPTAQPLAMGMEATLQWSNERFEKVDVGPAIFTPVDGATKITINAKSRLDLGVVSIPEDVSDIRFSPGVPKISAKAEIVRFSVTVFDAIRVNFSSVAFEVTEEGHKTFKTDIESIDLLPPLDFINQIASIFGGLGDDLGIHIDLSPQQIKISQTLRFPSGDEPLLMGPALITNLACSWFVTIPLMGRDVLAVGLGVSSREMPLTIWVPPYYGGKSYALVEATTKGCRLVEVSMEFGALIPINWGIAKGQASLTAGIFYMLQRNDPNSATVILRAFVKAAADLSVAGIIQFAGLIYIGLASGPASDQVSGIATVSVSIKIGFFRVSYSFSAEHSEQKHSGSSAASLMGARIVDEPTAVSFNAAKRRRRPSRRPARPPTAVFPFGQTFSSDRRAAYARVLAGYR